MNDLNLAFLIFLLEERFHSILIIGKNGVGKSFFIDRFKNHIKTTFLPLNATINELDDRTDLNELLKGNFKFQKGILSRAKGGVLVAENSSYFDFNILKKALNEKLVLTHNLDNPPLKDSLLEKIDLFVFLEDEEDKKLEIIRSNLESNFKNSWNLYGEILKNAKRNLENIKFTDEILRECLNLAKNWVKTPRNIFFAARAYAAIMGDSEIFSRHIERVAKFCILPTENKTKSSKNNHENSSDKKLDNKGEEDNQNSSKKNVLDKGFLNLSNKTSNKSTSIKQTKPKEEIFKAGKPLNIKDFLLKQDDKKRAILGLRTDTKTDKKVGRTIRTTNKKGDDIDIVATIKEAAIWQKFRGRKDNLIINSSDIRVKQRQAKSSYTIIVAIDISGSMGASGRIKKAKEFCLGVLKNAYIKRENIAVIAFRESKAKCIVSPTRASLVIKNELNALSTGGKTPLAAALKEIYMLSRNIRKKEATRRVLSIIITDARANSKLDDSLSFKEEVKLWCGLLKKSDIEFIVVDSEKKDLIAFDKALELAKYLDAMYLRINEFY